MPKFAANLSMMFTEHPFPERFAAAAQAGFKAVEFMFPYDHPRTDIIRWRQEADVEIVLFNTAPGNVDSGEWGIACLPGREQEFETHLALALDYAEALDTPRIHVMAGHIPAGTTPQLCHETFIRNLRHAAHKASAKNVTVLIEPLNPIDRPGFFLQTQAQAQAIRREVGAANLKVQMDFYHVQRTEGDISAKLRANLDEIGHIQIASAPDRHEPDEGELDYRHLFPLIDALGYRGWVGCEYNPRGRTQDGLGWLTAYR